MPPEQPEILADDNDLVLKTNAEADIIFAMGTEKAQGVSVRSMMGKLDGLSSAADADRKNAEDARNSLQSSLTSSITQLSGLTATQIVGLNTRTGALEASELEHASRLNGIDGTLGQVSNTVQQHKLRLDTLDGGQKDLQTQLTSLEGLVGDKVDLDAHNIHITVTDALGELLTEVQGTVADQKDAIAAATAAANDNSVLLTSALTCAKKGGVWDPEATPAACVQPLVRVGEEEATCIADLRGALRYNHDNGNLEVRPSMLPHILLGLAVHADCFLSL